MTASKKETQSIEELRTEVENMKAQRVEELKAQAEERRQREEMDELKRQLETLKSGGIPNSGVGYVPQGAQVPGNGVVTPTMTDLKTAAVRQVICGFSHGLFGPISSVYYGAKTGYWLPTLAATGVAVLTVPVALIDFGFTFAVAPPITSAALLITASQEKRRRLGITMPEQADAMMMKFRTF